MGPPKLYTYEELKIMSKKRLPSDVDRDRLEVRPTSSRSSDTVSLFSVICPIMNFIRYSKCPDPTSTVYPNGAVLI